MATFTGHFGVATGILAGLLVGALLGVIVRRIRVAPVLASAWSDRALRSLRSDRAALPPALRRGPDYADVPRPGKSAGRIDLTVSGLTRSVDQDGLGSRRARTIGGAPADNHHLAFEDADLVA